MSKGRTADEVGAGGSRGTWMEKERFFLKGMPGRGKYNRSKKGGRKRQYFDEAASRS